VFHFFICLACCSLSYLFVYCYYMPNAICPIIGGRANYDPDAATAIVVYKV
jgi:hypothetical protein